MAYWPVKSEPCASDAGPVKSEPCASDAGPVDLSQVLVWQFHVPLHYQKQQGALEDLHGLWERDGEYNQAPCFVKIGLHGLGHCWKGYDGAWFFSKKPGHLDSVVCFRPSDEHCHEVPGYTGWHSNFGSGCRMLGATMEPCVADLSDEPTPPWRAKKQKVDGKGGKIKMKMKSQFTREQTTAQTTV